jgi:serine phosphatase RsbU (regulator of sigma subunit)/anti-sigma regulatory factor (Ser/Thr protein kinase)
MVSAGGEWLRTMGAEYNFSQEDLYRMEVCFEELISNVVNYSDPVHAEQLVHVDLVVETQRATLTLSDPAAPYNPFSRSSPPKVNSIGEMQVGGQGVHLVRSFSDAHSYERRDKENRVELVFDLSQPTRQPARPGRVDRQIDRRQRTGRAALADPSPDQAARPAEDRRSMGFISWAQIFHGVPYSAIEPMADKLILQDIVGTIVLRKQGEMNDAVRVVLRGLLKAYLDHPGSGDYIDIEAGTCFGEMSIIDDRPVSAFVVAQAGSRLLLVDANTFLDQVLAIPRVSRNMMSILSARMRRSEALHIQRMRKAMEMEQTQRELQYARSIQEGLLPREPLFSGETRMQCVGRMRTAREVGGDFYDVFFLDADHVFFVIADVCGKGLPAALFMVRAIAILRAQSGYDRQFTDYTARLISRLNQQLCDYNDARQFLTAFCGIVDLETRTLRYVNAGHNAPALALADQPFEYLAEPINPIVGMFEGLNYRVGEVQLSSGSALLLYTDGVTEAENNTKAMLGEEPFLGILNAANSRAAGDLVDTVFSAVSHFAGDAPQSDDITVLALRWT